MPSKILVLLFCTSITTACVTESKRELVTESVVTKNTTYNGVRSNLVVGNFENRSGSDAGLFGDNSSKLGSQAKTILLTHLQQTQRFIVLERTNMQMNAEEAKLAGIEQKIKGARVVVTGNVTEFGRKTIGDKQLFGIFGYGKTQVAYAKVMLNVVDVSTSAVIHSVQAAGEFDLSNREVLGFGGTAGYDSTLNGKVLDLAIREGVNKLVSDYEAKLWTI